MSSIVGPKAAADVVDDNCTPLTEGVGELVIRAPWIGMARGFWNNEERYLETYWSNLSIFMLKYIVLVIFKVLVG